MPSSSFRVLAGSLTIGLGALHAHPVSDFIRIAKERHGEAGEQAAKFLADSMPPQDRETLTSDFLARNLDLAFAAREEFPWARSIPQELFFNDVLPYAVFDEAREDWRADFMARARGIVKGSKTATEAAQALNRELFNLVSVHYDASRKRPNQSPKESMELGKATCTGLSILLIDACRSVGIPARAVGVPVWSGSQGNHTWVEIWDAGWHFTGADEYNAAGLDRGWFTADAEKAEGSLLEYSIYATSWKSDGQTFFPLMWSQENREVGAVNVTSRYARRDDPAKARLRFTVKLQSDAPVKVSVLDERGSFLGEAELREGSDAPVFQVTRGLRVWLRFTRAGDVREVAAGPFDKDDPVVETAWQDLKPAPAAVTAVESWLAQPPAKRDPEAEVLQISLSKDEATRIAGLLACDRLTSLAGERKRELETKAVVHDGKIMPWLERTFGDTPPGGHSLWISMHGGGEAPAAINDQQWQNQIRLYQPAEGIYIAPRAPTNTWNMWHQDHIDRMFQRIIEDYVALRGVNPDKVYLMGYSAGGDGVWQLAPRMADRFAAASMMAGHPNEASQLGLRNLPFGLFMGANDAAVGRNKMAAEKSALLDQLQKDDPQGYLHMVRIYPGMAHWMELKDAESVPWMAGFARHSWPRKIVWVQDDVTHDRYYWLKIPSASAAVAGQKIVAEVEGQIIRLDGDVPAKTQLRLSDALLDLDGEVTIVVNGKEAFRGKVPRTAAAAWTSLQERADLPAAATAICTLP